MVAFLRETSDVRRARHTALVRTVRFIWFTAQTAIGKPEPGGSFIFVANDGTRRVRLLNLPEQNLSLSFGPWSKQDREQLNTANAEIAPLTLAEK